MNLSAGSDLSAAPDLSLTPWATPSPTGTPSAAERVLASELAGRSESHDALSMMVTSMVRMVQAGKMRQSRWKDC